jgi:hypothetical protein
VPEFSCVVRIVKILPFQIALYSITEKANKTQKSTYTTQRSTLCRPKTQLPPIFMSKQPQDNAITINVALKRKRAPVWPSATRAQCEEVIISLITAEGILQEFSPPDKWRINPGTAKGKVQHERLVRTLNGQGLWTSAKIRQHAQDPERSAGATSFEGGHLSTLNTSFTKLLRSSIRGRRGGPSSDANTGAATARAPTRAPAEAAEAAAATTRGAEAASAATAYAAAEKATA